MHGAWFLAAAGWLACGQAEPATEEEPVMDTATDTMPAENVREEGAVAPELRAYPLRIVNHFSAQIVVWASAGAQRVVLDTVPARDSARIDVQVRAQRILLEVTDASGRPLLQHDLALLPDTLTRWVAEPEPGEARTGRL